MTIRKLTRSTAFNLAGALLLAGCAASATQGIGAAGPVNPDALMNDFVTTWERDDAAGVRGLFADDALVIVGTNPPSRSVDAVERDFIRYNLPVARDLRITPLDRGTSGSMAYQTGSYTQRIERTNGAPYTQTGRHTFVWQRQPAGEWKLKSVLIDPDPAPANLAAEEAAIRELDRRWAQAAVQGDVNFIRNLFAPDARFLAPNAPPIVGRDAIGQAFGQVLSAPGAQLRFGESDVKIAPSGQVAYTTGTYTYAFDTPRGRVQDQGKNLIVWRKIDGEWKVVEDMFNSDVPMQ